MFPCSSNHTSLKCVSKTQSNAPVLPALNHLTSPSHRLLITKAPQFFWIYSIVSALPPLMLSSPSPQRWPHPRSLPLSSLFRPLPSVLLSLSSYGLKYPYPAIPTSFHAPSLTSSSLITSHTSDPSLQSKASLVCIAPWPFFLLVADFSLFYLCSSQMLLLPHVLQCNGLLLCWPYLLPHLQGFCSKKGLKIKTPAQILPHE